MKLSAHKKLGLIAATLAVAVLAIALPNHAAHADGVVSSLIGSIAGGAIGWIAFVLIYIMSTIVGVFIALLTYLISVILLISNNIVNTLAVQSGFTVTLAVANLGFVLAIIVIAIATILRRETYGIKKSLWKLVVAAILVNFSLVIGGAIITFANNFTTAFLTQLPGGGGSGGGNCTIDLGPMCFAQELAGAFSPQRNLLGFSVDGSGVNINVKGANSTDASSDLGLSTVLVPILEVFSAAAMLIVITIVLAVFLVMLMVRYVALSILLILMPFAWLLWLFPQTSKHWSKWWNEFIRWTFFAPIVVFFLWLAIATGQAMNANSKNSNNPLAQISGSSNSYDPKNNSIMKAIDKQFTDFVGVFAGTVLQGVIMVGLSIGGMIVADKMGIAFAGAATSTAAATGNWVKGYAGSRSKQLATSPLRTERARNYAAQLQQPGQGIIKRYTGRILSQGAAYGGEHAIADSKSSIGNDTADQNREKLSTSRAPIRMARLQKLISDNKVSELSEAELQQYAGKDQENTYKRYGADGQKIYNQLREKSGLALRDLQKDEQDLIKNPAATPKEQEEKLKENKDKQIGLLQKITPEDLAAQFQDPEKRQKAVEKLKADGKPVPASLSLDKESIQRMQVGIVDAITKGFSPPRAFAVIEELSKKGSTESFEKTIKNLKEPGSKTYDPAKFASVRDGLIANTNLMAYIKNNPSKAIIDYNGLFELTEADYPKSKEKKEEKKDKEEPRIQMAPGAGEESQADVDAREASRNSMQAERERLQRERGQNI